MYECMNVCMSVCLYVCMYVMYVVGTGVAFAPEPCWVAFAPE